MKKTIILLCIISLYACTSEKKEKVISENDYNTYLINKETPSKDVALEDLAFWNSRIKEDSLQIIEMSKLAGVHGALFSTTGDISELITSEMLIKKALATSARNKDNYLRSLAHNYISQHRFKEAKVLLDSAYAYKDNKKATEFMLFDVSMELGDYETADKYLGMIKNNSDYNYLIRLSKWSDHKGDLDSAIRYMEKAKTIAESGGNKELKIWTYTNIADFYGHAGRIADAYKHYIMTLELQPDNSYAKKGIAWIAYSYENDTKEANRILDSIMVHHKVPDYFLLKAEMAEHNGNVSEANKQQDNFITAVTSTPNYGGMYNTYLIKLYTEIDPEKALALARKEVKNRATPETYQLLAYAQLKAGKKQEALTTIEDHVIDKTFEPKALLHAALIYKANGMNDKIPAIKEELQGASFELGPVIMKEVNNL